MFTSTQISKGTNRKSTRETPMDATECGNKNQELPQTIKKLNGSPLVLNSVLTRKIAMGKRMSPKYASSPVQSPLGQKQNCETEDLWTDEEIFEDDSFIIKATQVDMFATPKAPKRRTPDTTPTSNPKVPKHKFNLDGISPIQKVKETDKNNCTSVHSHHRINQKQLPFQSYYEKNKSQSGSQGNQHMKNNKENIMSTSTSVSSSKMENSKRTISSKPVRQCMIVPAKRSSATQQTLVHGVYNRVETRTPGTTTSSVIRTQAAVRATVSSAVRPVMGPPNITSKPLNGVRQNGFSANNSQFCPRGPSVKQVIPTVTNTSGMKNCLPATSQRWNSSTTVTVTATSQKLAAPPKQKTQTVSSISTLSKHAVPSFGTRSNQKSTRTPPRVTALVNEGRNPGQFNTSLTDDLLATLAEPDDLLDSQIEKDASRSKCPAKPVNDDSDDLLLMVDDAIEIGLEPTASKCLE